MGINRFFRAAIGLLLPLQCVTCHTPLPSDEQRHLCPRCWENLERLRPWFCQRCSLPLPDGGAHCARCRSHPLAITEIRAGGLYQGTLRTCLLLFKYGQKEFLATPLAEILAEGLQRSPRLPAWDIIVPVPLDRWRRWRRGYNQAELLANEVGKRLDLPVAADGLQKTQRTHTQVGLSRPERLQNLRGVFCDNPRSPIKGYRVLLIDDVCTTGTTLQECARALRKGGATHVSGGVVARDSCRRNL